MDRWCNYRISEILPKIVVTAKHLDMFFSSIEEGGLKIRDELVWCWKNPPSSDCHGFCPLAQWIHQYSIAVVELGTMSLQIDTFASFNDSFVGSTTEFYKIKLKDWYSTEWKDVRIFNSIPYIYYLLPCDVWVSMTWLLVSNLVCGKGSLSLAGAFNLFKLNPQVSQSLYDCMYHGKRYQSQHANAASWDHSGTCGWYGQDHAFCFTWHWQGWCGPRLVQTEEVGWRVPIVGGRYCWWKTSEKICMSHYPSKLLLWRKHPGIRL